MGQVLVFKHLPFYFQHVLLIIRAVLDNYSLDIVYNIYEAGYNKNSTAKWSKKWNRIILQIKELRLS